MPSKYLYHSHQEVARAHFNDLNTAIQDVELEVDGSSLTLATVVAVSKFSCQPYLTQKSDTLNGINNSVLALRECLANGHPIYGVNTGFGGSADSRTDHVITLQKSLLQLLQSGILTSKDTTSGNDGSKTLHGSQSMPSEWVRATMLVRCNSVVKGHSAVSLPVINGLLQLLQKNATPVVPLRGTISASGDLMPLAYVTGAMEGNPGIFVQVGGDVVTAQDALKKIGMKAVTLGPKEGLGLVNGTAASAAVASLALYETHQLALLAQIITALSVEALRGSTESFHPFIAEVRPHDGQAEVAANVLSLLQTSRLARGEQATTVKTGLAQDRYSLRTAGQWLGPQLEDLLLADHQIGIELNSTTDNPLVDSAARTTYSGGNFQATSVTSAMEKTRLALQMIGKLLFTQCTEMIDPSLNNGLPTNLVADDPSLSFTMKGVDINMAAYMAELAYLANPVSTHVQTAEMHNQALNSLAFVSARYTMQAVDLVSMMTACSLYVACQALDLRVLQLSFFNILQPLLVHSLTGAFCKSISEEDLQEACQRISEESPSAWESTARLDLHDRCEKVIDFLLPTILSYLTRVDRQKRSDVCLIEVLTEWKKSVIPSIKAAYLLVLHDFCKAQNTAEYLGSGTRVIYVAVRHQLQVPFHRGFIEHPIEGEPSVNTIDGRDKKTIGGWISVIYQALRDGELGETVNSAF
ncbi:L-Aspartase-like protein [Aspergillus bertholletiae]|uniref:L-Aspartase-like protein n=1 Tax=Aspergillus bertholletiae TaxID=1226010 RepID=A0A5N7BBB1_9EURO|nr:L-Aspartase-like protein [Aspergillus bertholletiae]